MDRPALMKKWVKKTTYTGTKRRKIQKTLHFILEKSASTVGEWVCMQTLGNFIWFSGNIFFYLTPSLLNTQGKWFPSRIMIIFQNLSLANRNSSSTFCNFRNNQKGVLQQATESLFLKLLSSIFPTTHPPKKKP